MSTEMLVALLLILGCVIFVYFYTKKQEEAKEQARVEDIQSHQSEWGEDMCNWLVQNKFTLSNARVAGIMQKFDEFGAETCQNLLQQKIGIGYTDEMVRLSLGEPTSVDNKEITEKWEKFRWIFGVPRQGAVYIWFKDGKVTKIKS